MRNEIREASRRLMNLSEMKRCAGRAKAYQEAALEMLAFSFRYDRMTRTQKLLKIKSLIERWERRSKVAWNQMERLAKK
jgi:hypothetical protein